MADVSNGQRADWALSALSGFVVSTGADTAGDAISDLIVDLLHLAKGRGLDTSEMMQQINRTFEAEGESDADCEMLKAQQLFQHLLPDDGESYLTLVR